MGLDRKNFSLTGYFAGISLLGLVVASLLMAYVFGRHNDAILRTSAETQNLSITRSLGNFIFPKFEHFIGSNSGMSAEALRSHPRTAELRSAVAAFVRGTHVVKVKIYDLDGRVVFSSEARQIGADQSANQGFQAARKGRIASELTYRGTFDAFEGTLENRNLMSSYVPVHDEAGTVAAVFEIYSDVSELIAQMEETRTRVIFIVGTPMLALFFVLLTFMRKADGVIREQRNTLEHANEHLEEMVAARTGELSSANLRLSDKIGELEDAKETIRKASTKFQQMLEIQRRMSVELDLDVLVPMAMSEISRYMGADRSSLFLFDWKNMELSSRFAQGLAGNPISIPLRMGIVGTAILNRKTYNISNAYEHPYFNPRLDQVLNFRTESILVAPIVDPAGKVMGGLQLLNKNTGRFSPADEQRVEKAAAMLANTSPMLDPEQAKTSATLLHEAIQCDRVTVFRLDESEGRLVSIYAEGVERSEISLSMQLGIAGLVAVTAQDMVLTDVAGDPRSDRHFDNITGYVTKNMVCMPIRARKGDILGVVQVINKQGGDFDAQDVDVLRSLVAVFSVFIENAMLFDDQDVQFHSMLEVMAASIDAKDSLTAGHSQNVANIARRIGQALGFTDHELEVLHVAALLHDYGKIGISDAVLKKEGTLTPEEYEHIRHHAKMTHSILEKIYFARKYRSVPIIAGSHHEYLDGSGYPQGLTAKQIPFMSKILTVADVFEALTADRHYRRGMSAAKAMTIIRADAGTRFDPNVIAALDRTLANADGVPWEPHTPG